jgi:hypothetical protein
LCGEVLQARRVVFELDGGVSDWCSVPADTQEVVSRFLKRTRRPCRSQRGSLDQPAHRLPAWREAWAAARPERSQPPTLAQWLMPTTIQGGASDEESLAIAGIAAVFTPPPSAGSSSGPKLVALLTRPAYVGAAP